MEITKYLPFRCIIFVSESTFIVGVRMEIMRFNSSMFFLFLKGHEFSPMIYNYDGQKGTIEFVEKLDLQDGTSGKQAVGLEFQFLLAFFLIIFL
jgi:hypothetical protein